MEATLIRRMSKLAVTITVVLLVGALLQHAGISLMLLLRMPFTLTAALLGGLVLLSGLMLYLVQPAPARAPGTDGHAMNVEWALALFPAALAAGVAVPPDAPAGRES